MGDEDVRWKQRYQNYQRSLANLRDALATTDPDLIAHISRVGIRLYDAGSPVFGDRG
ncbi:MAG: hypothetical protein ACLFR8_14230 [Alkalispirochaeta sp.]